MIVKKIEKYADMIPTNRLEHYAFIVDFILANIIQYATNYDIVDWRSYL